MTGFFLTVEGIDGSGKTTQAVLLAKDLRARGLKVLETREPGGNPLSEAIRRILLETTYHVDPVAETLLYAAARAQLVSEVIRPEINRGKVVVCDRFVDSSLAYQGSGLGYQGVGEINALATGGLLPRMTLLFDIPPEEAMQRSGRDRIESRDLEYYRRVRQGYLDLARGNPNRFRVIAVSGRSIEDVHQEVLPLVLEALSREGIA